jgi:hypothetical protein
VPDKASWSYIGFNDEVAAMLFPFVAAFLIEKCANEDGTLTIDFTNFSPKDIAFIEWQKDLNSTVFHLRNRKERFPNEGPSRN